MPDAFFSVTTNPSLALVKYWGKQPGKKNLPATSSLAVSLAALSTQTDLSFAPGSSDVVVVDGAVQPSERYTAFFEEARNMLALGNAVSAVSRNNFPAASGLASSSSGFAALALGCVLLAADQPVLPETGSTLKLADADLIRASRLARLGSASAARAVFGGWTWLPAGAEQAEPIHPADYWPDFRVLVVIVRQAAKDVSSRSAMESTRLSSPFYQAWVEDAVKLSREARLALERRDMEALGYLARVSYCRMHASALAADPPLCYWLPDSLQVIQQCAELRSRGIGAWETMDAGPQVKILCLEKDLLIIRNRLQAALPALAFIETAVGDDPRCCLKLA